MCHIVHVCAHVMWVVVHVSVVWSVLTSYSNCSIKTLHYMCTACTAQILYVHVLHVLVDVAEDKRLEIYCVLSSIIWLFWGTLQCTIVKY